MIYIKIVSNLKNEIKVFNTKITNVECNNEELKTRITYL